jgi:hypothetical protein
MILGGEIDLILFLDPVSSKNGLLDPPGSEPGTGCAIIFLAAGANLA